MSKKIGDSLLETIGKSGGRDLFADAAELSLDQMLDGVIKDVPVFGTLTKLWKSGIAVRDHIFAQKLFRFLKNLNVTDDERRKFSERISTDQSFRRKVGEHLILILDRLDDLAKPEMLARAFRAFMRDEIHFYDFRVFALAIDRCLLDDLLLLRDARPGMKEQRHIHRIITPSGLGYEYANLSLASAGLVEFEQGYDIPYYAVTNLGQKFVHIMLDGFKNEEPVQLEWTSQSQYL